MKKIEIFGIQKIPEVKAGDNLPHLIINCARKEGIEIAEKDIIIISSKIISKVMGLTQDLENVQPSKKAVKLARKIGKNPKSLQMIWDCGHTILAIVPVTGLVRKFIINASADKECAERLCDNEGAMCVTYDAEGRISTHDAGIDRSNHIKGNAGLLPPNPDETAEAIREEIKAITGRNAAVLIADSEIIPPGTLDIAIGSSGIRPQTKSFGRPDMYGNPKYGGMDLISYELTSACALMFGQGNNRIPAAIVRGYDYELDTEANISNTLIPGVDYKEYMKTIKSVLHATAYAKGFKDRWMMRIASWFI